MEEENMMLKEILSLSDGELKSWKSKYGQMASLAISGFGLGNCDEVRDSETLANALLAELK
ncbi:Beta-hexosaminidase A [Bienertia sinuspersici]